MMNAKPSLFAFRLFRSIPLPQNLRRLLFYFLHPALMLLCGYSMVIWQLPVLFKTLLFLFVCVGAGWLIYQKLMRTKDYPANPA
jgi:hypothetical protein